MTRVATGRMSSTQEKPFEKDEEPGSQLSQKTKMATRKVAVANSGSDVVKTERTVIVRSRVLASLTPEITPRTSEMATVLTNTRPPSMAVLASRGSRKSYTGALNCADLFQLPVRKP